MSAQQRGPRGSELPRLGAGPGGAQRGPPARHTRLSAPGTAKTQDTPAFHVCSLVVNTLSISRKRPCFTTGGKLMHVQIQHQSKWDLQKTKMQEIVFLVVISQRLIIFPVAF